MAAQAERKLLGSVLVVEDEEDVCALLRDGLQGQGYAVTCALGDKPAYEILKREARRLDALVLDVNLGRGTTGFDVARYGRRLNPTIPVIFITGQPQESVDKFGVAGAVMLEKPFDLPSLLSTLQEMIEHA